MAIPYSPEANDLKAAFEKAYQTALASLPNKIRNVYAAEGYDVNVDVDANGKPTIGNFSVAGSNPYGTYQQNRRSSALAQSMLAERNAAGGLRGGLANRGMADIRMQTGMGDYSMLGRLEANKLGALSEFQRARSDYDQNLAFLNLTEARKNISSGNFTPAAVTDSPATTPQTYAAVQNPLQKALAESRGQQGGANAYGALQRVAGGLGRQFPWQMTKPAQAQMTRAAQALNNPMGRR